MAELTDVAQQFAKDLIGQNIAGLMMSFTPAGMGKAMALQAQRSAAGGTPAATSFEVKVVGQEGEDHLVDIIINTADGPGVMFTRWKDVAGAWKVDDIGMREG